MSLLEPQPERDLWATASPSIIASSRARIAREYRIYLAAKNYFGGTPSEVDQQMARWLARYDSGQIDGFFGEA